MLRSPKRHKVALALFCGLLVALAAAAIHAVLLPHDRLLLIHAGIGDFAAGLAAIIVSLAIQLKEEEVHYVVAVERAAIVSELNHHVRNAVFPLMLLVHKQADPEAARIADDALARLNLALQEATTDAISGRTLYGKSEQASAA